MENANLSRLQSSHHPLAAAGLSPSRPPSSCPVLPTTLSLPLPPPPSRTYGTHFAGDIEEPLRARLPLWRPRLPAPRLAVPPADAAPPARPLGPLARRSRDPAPRRARPPPAAPRGPAARRFEGRTKRRRRRRTGGALPGLSPRRPAGPRCGRPPSPQWRPGIRARPAPRRCPRPSGAAQVGVGAERAPGRAPGGEQGVPEIPAPGSGRRTIATLEDRDGGELKRRCGRRVRGGVEECGVWTAPG